MTDHTAAFEQLAEKLTARGIDLEGIKEALKAQKIETPSWAYGDSGTRFKVFPWPGAARNVYEKLADAAFTHELTGVCPSVALHIPWDKVDDWSALSACAADLGIRIGAINPNLFQDDAYRLGSVCHPDAAVRRQAIDHLLECVEICRATDSTLLSLWLADGTSYAGQDDLRARKRRLEAALAEVYAALPVSARLLIEYKFFEPAFYHTDLPDWGSALMLARKLGPQAQVLVDTGHHPQATNIEHIVAILLDEAKLGGFHFNSRKYADDDLIVGTVNPFELFSIFHELITAEASADPAVSACAQEVAYMIDQSHNIEGKIRAMLISIMNCQTAYAKALLVGRETLTDRQAAGDVLGAHRVLVDAYETDVRPLLAQVRSEMGLHPDPMAAPELGDYLDKVRQERDQAEATASGYPGA
jgi:L-rhamnose isomerase/sugar isomerase